MTDAQLSLGDDVKEALLRTDETFRQLVSEHQALDERLRNLTGLTFLTDQQRYEEISLKKKKLALKDRMQAMMRARTAVPASQAPRSSAGS
jgi:uncharacterized protein YdcH (DUF465 family)